MDDLADVFQLALCYFGVQVSRGTIGTDQLTRPTMREHNWKVLGAAPGILAKRRVATTRFTTSLCAFRTIRFEYNQPSTRMSPKAPILGC